MTRLDRPTLGRILHALDRDLDEPADLVLVGGAALLLLVDDARVTFDLDVLGSSGLERIARVARDLDFEGKPLPLSTRSAMFEGHLPPDWADRVRWHAIAHLQRLRVATPSPEDLAVMKVFRLLSKDADDILRLATLPGFDRDLFRRGFALALPNAVGEPRWHEQSFRLVWERLPG